MEFTTGITQFNTNYNLNAIDDYNKYLQGHASFEVEKTSFEEALENATKSHPIKDKAMGGPTSIHDAMIAAEKATLSMQMAIQVRNRLVSAYTDITSMAI